MPTRDPDCATLPLLPGQSGAPAEPLGRALEEIGVAAYMLDRSGEIVWLNQWARILLGDRVGRLYTDAVTPDTVPIARTAFTKKISGAQPRTHEVGFLFTADGARLPVEINAVAMRSDAEIIGVFGLISTNPRHPPAVGAWERAPVLTPRQRQVLEELARGASTDEIATHLALSRTTVRNHIAGALATLGCHTRLQAVIDAQRRGLID